MLVAVRDVTATLHKAKIWTGVFAYMLRSQRSWRLEGLPLSVQHFTLPISHANFAQERSSVVESKE
jgi:hypothetical protein